MAKTEFKLIRKPRTPKIQYRTVRAEVAKKLEPVAKQAVIARKKVVANWSNKPDFAYKISVKPEAIRIIVNLTRPKKLKNSDGNTNDLWKWIDKGTKPHVITAKRKPYLHFVAGDYQSKTGANPARFGGPGVVRDGQFVKVKSVEHPGFEGRDFSGAINKDLRPKFNTAIDSGYRAGLRKAKSG